MDRAHHAGAGPAGATIAIDRLAAGGEGVGRLGGKVAFVPGTAPGDLVEVAGVEDRRSFCRARVRRIIRPSPDRAAPRCPAFGVCGGCCWQHVAYPAQLDAKRVIVEDALRRIGRLAPPPVPGTAPAPREYGYRHRARLHVEHRGAAAVFGFYAARSTSVVPLERCPVLHESLETVFGVLAAAASRHPVFARCAEARADADWRGATVRLTLRETGGRPLRLPDAAERELREGCDRCGVSLLVGEGAEGPLRLGPAQDALVATGEAFTQINLAQNLVLVATAVELAAPRPGEEVLDLYCGLGNLSLPLSAAGARVLGVDLDAAAVRQADDNARRLGRAATFRSGDAAAACRELAAAGRRFALVVLNPPRTGAREAIAGLAALAPGRILVVSCDPATLARDAAGLAGQGYRLETVRPIDLFPQTAHIETVALFRRSG